MSKCAVLIAFLLTCAASAHPHVGLDQVGFRIKFEVQECYLERCISDDNLPEEVVLNLSFADWIDNTVVQRAYFTQMISLTSNNYAVSVTVVRTTSSTGEQYSMTAEVGPVFGSYTPALATVSMGPSKSLQTPIFLEGPHVEYNGFSYRPRVTISAI